MSSNRLHNIFGNRRRLSREDIDTYGQTNDPGIQNSIEQSSMTDSFEADAMEGWDELSHDTAVMHTLDKKFAPSTGSALYWVAGAIAVGVTAVLVFNFVGTPEPEPQLAEEQNSTPTQTSEQIITVEETDILVPEEIEQMTAAPEQEQVQPQDLQHDFVAIQEVKEEHQDEHPQEIENLPVIDQDEPFSPEIISHRFNAKEIYLNGLKLIDYREYRAQPKVEIKQYVLSGTPANVEERGGTPEFDATPQVTDIPYIDYVEKTTRIFNRGNFKKALSRFEVILETYEDDANANFYAGICLYNFGEYSKALTHFEKCLDGNYLNFDEEALWHIALCYEHLGQTTKANKLYKEIVKANGFYKSQAQAKLK